jgi:hypothetical protein
MRRALLGLSLLLAAGCGGGNGHIAARGTVTKGGQPFTLGEGEGVRIIFAPESGSAGEGKYDSFPAEYNGADGTFVVRGKDGTGLPPGKYSVSLQWLKQKEDLFNGQYTGKKSPLKCEVASGKDVVIDLGSGAAN